MSMVHIPTPISALLYPLSEKSIKFAYAGDRYIMQNVDCGIRRGIDMQKLLGGIFLWNEVLNAKWHNAE